MDTPRQIHARIHDSALKRVNRMFSASLPDIFSETLQNARRANATRVHVRLEEHDERRTLTVHDDGDGILDPALLLSFGENGWEKRLVHREDAAGMGLLSLAKRGCTVASRPRDGTAAWRVALQEPHFLGDAGADVAHHDGAPHPHGSAVAFPALAHENAVMIRNALGAAALHYPLPIRFSHETRGKTSRGEQTMRRKAFLDGAVHAETWRGLAFGVIKHDRPAAHELKDLNFHGLTLRAELPEIQTLDGATWNVRADVVECPELELVLPARKEIVQTPFLEAMRQAARNAIYRAIAREPIAYPAFRDWKRAREAGIDIPPHPPELAPWKPGTADPQYGYQGPTRRSVGDDALLASHPSDAPRDQALARALERSPIEHRLFTPEQRLAGYPWYDALARLHAVNVDVMGTDGPCPLEDYPTPLDRGWPHPQLPARPEAIRMRLSITRSGGGAHSVAVPADLAFAGEAWDPVRSAHPLVTVDSDLSAHELADLLKAAFFSPSDDPVADSWETQERSFEQEATHIARRLLTCDEAARHHPIAEAVEEATGWLLPPDHDVDIAIRERRVQVTFRERARA